MLTTMLANLFATLSEQPNKMCFQSQLRTLTAIWGVHVFFWVWYRRHDPHFSGMFADSCPTPRQQNTKTGPSAPNRLPGEMSYGGSDVTVSLANKVKAFVISFVHTVAVSFQRTGFIYWTRVIITFILFFIQHSERYSAYLHYVYIRIIFMTKNTN